MGYRCPVCEDPQADDTHLANHLAFTAILRGGAHEDWLDEHVPGWEAMGETGLAPRVAELAESAEYPVSPEDTAGRAGGDGHGHEDGHGREDGHGHEDSHGRGERRRGVDRPEVAGTPFGAGIDETAREAIEQAREMTRQRRANARKDEPDTDSVDSGDGDSQETERSDDSESEGDSESRGEQ